MLFVHGWRRTFLTVPHGGRFRWCSGRRSLTRWAGEGVVHAEAGDTALLLRCACPSVARQARWLDTGRPLAALLLRLEGPPQSSAASFTPGRLRVLPPGAADT